MLIADNRCFHQMIQKELNFGSAVTYKNIHEELRMKKLVCHWVPPDLTKYQKGVSVRICKEILKLPSDGERLLISKIIIGDEM